MASFIGAEGNRSLSDNGSYVEFVESAVRDYAVFQNFKQSPVYRTILEHTGLPMALEYLKVVAKQHPHWIEVIAQFTINDQVGNPELFDFPVIGPISTSTLRYVKVASDLTRLFGEMKDFRIAEIGVGYGGQLLVLDQVAKCKSYHLFDLPPVLQLASRYLESHTLNAAYQVSTLNQTDGDTHYDLVISNYAFSELPSKLQRKYIEKIIRHSDRGYLTMNSGSPDCPFVGDFLSFEQLAELLPEFRLRKELENYPSNTYILCWGEA